MVIAAPNTEQNNVVSILFVFEVKTLGGGSIKIDFKVTQLLKFELINIVKEQKKEINYIMISFINFR